MDISSPRSRVFSDRLDSGVQALFFAVDDAPGAARRRSGDRPKRPSGVSTRKPESSNACRTATAWVRVRSSNSAASPAVRSRSWVSRYSARNNGSAASTRSDNMGSRVGPVRLRRLVVPQQAKHDQGESLGVSGCQSVEKASSEQKQEMAALSAHSRRLAKL